MTVERVMCIQSTNASRNALACPLKPTVLLVCTPLKVQGGACRQDGGEMPLVGQKPYWHLPSILNETYFRFLKGGSAERLYEEERY